MMQWKIKEIAEVVGAKNNIEQWEDTSVSSFSIDTRLLEAGSLFVPIVAERDGHEFAEAARDQGAVAVFWEKDLEEAPEGLAIIQVDYAKKAFQTFAKYYLKEVVDPLVVAITGSNGKTTTKDMTASVLAQKYKTHSTEGNFNNELGLPLTLLAMPEDTEAVVLEMGMNQVGEIDQLSRLAEPDLAAITMVGESHLEFFGSRDKIADAKMEIVNGMDQGVLVYNGDQTLLEERVQKANLKARISFGQKESNDYHPLDVQSGLKETTFSVNVAPEQEVTIPVTGAYNANNALIAIAIGQYLNIPFADILQGLADFQLTESRLEWGVGLKNQHLLNDAYNASPTSMRASISSFLELDISGDRYLVLGEMGELGEASDQLHRSVKSAINPSKVKEILLFGNQMKGLYDDLMSDSAFSKVKTQHFKDDKTALIEYIKETTGADDYLLFKSSQSTGLVGVVDELKTQ
jgi:UDP-N-acetylmuramoyl-tripeptide--D-alanyl-D-alanine ligase